MFHTSPKLTSGPPRITSPGRAFYVQEAVPMRLPDAGRLPRNIFHPVQIGCELACSPQLIEIYETCYPAAALPCTFLCQATCSTGPTR